MELRDGPSPEVRAGAGVDWDTLVQNVVRRGWTGVECLSGIPGTVGGTPIQNVGAYGQEIAETLVSVTCLDRTALERRTLSARDCAFGYRDSRFKATGPRALRRARVTLRLARDQRPRIRYPELQRAVAELGRLDAVAPGDAVRLVREAVLALRRRKSMVLDPEDPNTRSAGSFFTNRCCRPPPSPISSGAGRHPLVPADAGVKVPAAWLVEQAGFHKGYRRGRGGRDLHPSRAGPGESRRLERGSSGVGGKKSGRE